MPGSASHRYPHLRFVLVPGMCRLVFSGRPFPRLTFFLAVFPRGYYPALHGVDPRNFVTPPLYGRGPCQHRIMTTTPRKALLPSGTMVWIGGRRRTPRSADVSRTRFDFDR